MFRPLPTGHHEVTSKYV